MKNINKLFAIVTVLLLALSILAVPAFAAKQIPGTDTITFDKYLTMDKNANVPDAEFSFEIESGAAVAAVIPDDHTPVIMSDPEGEGATGARTPAVMAGPEGAVLTYGTTTDATVVVDFKPGDTTYTDIQSGDSVTLGENTKYAKETVTVDLTGVTFTEPGIYRYNITETALNDGVANDETATRYLDIYIDSNDAGELSIQGSIMHNTPEVMEAGGGVYAAKDGGFQNDYTTYDLSFSKQITGNQGFRGKYFTFTVAIAGADAGTTYTVDLSKASTSDGNGNDNVAVLVADDTGAVTGTFYLKDDETITIYGLTAETMYTISEDAQDYTPSYSLDGGDTVNGNSTPENVKMLDSNHDAAFTNYRNGIVPTGILLDIAPYAILVLLAIAAAVIMISKKRHNASR